MALPILRTGRSPNDSRRRGPASERDQRAAAVRNGPDRNRCVAGRRFSGHVGETAPAVSACVRQRVCAEPRPIVMHGEVDRVGRGGDRDRGIGARRMPDDVLQGQACDAKRRSGDVARGLALVAVGCVGNVERHADLRPLLDAFGEPLERRDEPADVELDRMTSRTQRLNVGQDLPQRGGKLVRRGIALGIGESAAEARDDIGVEVAGDARSLIEGRLPRPRTARGQLVDECSKPGGRRPAVRRHAHATTGAIGCRPRVTGEAEEGQSGDSNEKRAGHPTQRSDVRTQGFARAREGPDGGGDGREDRDGPERCRPPLVRP